MNRNQAGMVLPMALAMVAMLAILTFALSWRNQTRSVGDLKDFIGHNKYHGLAHAGVNKAEFNLKSPDDPDAAHVWAEGTESSMTFETGKGKVKVKVKDKKIN